MEGLYSKPCEYCPYCKDHVNNQFYKIAEFEDGGLEIWHSGERNASAKSPQGDMYILRITKNTGTDSNNLAPDLDVRQINCPRCRFKLSHVQKLMQSVPISFKKGLTGVCDQCAAKQTPQDPCYICAKTLKEFLTFEKEKWKRGQPPYFDREKPFLSKQGKGIEVTDMFKPTSSLRGWHSEDSLTKKATRGDYFPRDHMKETTRDKMFGSADIITGTAEPGKRVDVYQKYKVPDFISGKRLPDDSEIRDQTWEHGKYKDQRGKRDLDQLKYEPTASTADIDPRTGTRVKQQKPVDSKVEEKEQFDQTTRVKPDKIFMKAKDQKDEKVERSEFQKGGIVHESSKDKAGEKVSRGGDGQSYERGKQIEHRDVDKKDKVDKTARDGKGDRSDKHAEQSKIKKSSKVDITSKDKNLGGGRGKDDEKGESARDKSKEKVTRGGESKEIGKKGEKTKSSETVRDKSKEKGDDAKEIDKKGAKTKPTIAEKSGKPDKTVRSGDSKGDETRRTAESSEAEKKEKIDKTSKDKSGDKSLGGGRGKDDEKNKIADQREGEKKGKDSTPRDKTGKKVTVDSAVKDDDKEGRGEKKARDSTPRDKTGKKVTVDSAVKDDDKEGRGEKKAKDSTSKDKSGKKVTTDSDVKDDDKEGRSEKKAKDSTSKDKTGKKVNDDEKEGRGVKKEKDSILKDKIGKKVTTDSDVKDDKKEGISKKSKPSEKDQFNESAKRGDGKSDKKKKDIDRSEGEKKGKSDKIGSKMSKDIGSEPEEDPTPRQRDHTTRDASGKKIKTPKGGEKEKGQAKPGEKTSREKDDEKEKGKAKKDIEKGKKSTSKEVDKKGHGKLKSDQGAKVEKKIYLKELDETKEKAPDDSLSVPADKVKIQQSSPDLITKLVQQRDRDRDKHEAETDELYLLPKLPKKRRIVHTAEMTDTDKESELELDRDEARHVAEETKEIIVGTHLLPRSEVHVKYEPPVVLTDFEEAYFPSVPLEATSETSQDLKKNIGVIRYALSDRTFIENGYTVLPTIKTFRKINLYRMRPANPEKNWFERNKGKGIITYCSGEKMAEIDEKGRGFLFYKNGRVALEYHDAEG